MTIVLLVRLSAMGDVVQSLGAVAALHRARPAWRLVFVTQEPFVPLLDGLPGLADVVPFARRGGLQAFWRLRRALRAQRADFAVDLQGNWKSALVARCAGARVVLGIGGPWRQEPASRWLLGRTVDGSGAPHPARMAFDLVASMAPDATFELARLQARDDEVAAERRRLLALGFDTARPFGVVIGSDPRDPRALRPHRVAELLATSDRPWLWLAGPDEREIAAPAGVPVLRHERGEVRRLLALGALVAQAGGLVVGPDQGASHVLAATGARCRVLFGAQDPMRTAPPAAHSFLHPDGPSCRPCRSHRCHRVEGPVCMDFPILGGVEAEVGLPAAPNRPALLPLPWPLGQGRAPGGSVWP
ncbi:MAG: glycosyltransferase family 9 protein [Planctomycetota bacterium]